MKVENILKNIAFLSTIFLAIGVSTSVSISALSHVFIVVPAVFFGVKGFSRKELSLSQWGMFGIVATIFLSVFFNFSSLVHPFKSLFKVKYFVIAFFSVFAYKALIRSYFDRKKLSIVLNLFLIATTIATVSGLIGLYSGFNPIKMKNACHESRACGLFGMYMTYAYGISLFLILVSGLIIHYEKVKDLFNKKFLYFVLAINFVGLYYSFARGAWIGFLVALPFFFYKKNKKKFVGIFLTGLLLVGASFVISKDVRKMFLQRSGSNSQRLAMYQTAWLAFKEKPIFGYGYRNFEPNSVKIKKKYGIGHSVHNSHAHNNYMEHLASTGILGFLAILLFTLAWLKESFEEKTIIDTLSFPFVISFIVSGMVQYTFGDGENLFLILNLWAIGQAFRSPYNVT